MNNYEINRETLLLIPIKGSKTKVIEVDNTFIVDCSTQAIIKKSCLFFGSSYEGRREAIKNLIGVMEKVPILVEESRNIIFFPMTSSIKRSYIWISYQNLLNYTKFNEFSTVLYFRENCKIKLDVKYKLLDNQIVRCLKLDAILLKRKFIVNE